MFKSVSKCQHTAPTHGSFEDKMRRDMDAAASNIRSRFALKLVAGVTSTIPAPVIHNT